MRSSEYMQSNPVRLDMSRSKFHQSPRWTGTFNAGKLVPIYCNGQVLPGTTIKMAASFVVRSTTPVAPVMDDLFMDVAFYWVPNDLILSRSYMSPSTNDSNHSWKAFIGAQDSLLNMPVPASGIKVPYFTIDTAASPDLSAFPVYFGLGLKHASAVQYRITCLQFLAFMAVWNENYREPNIQTPGVYSLIGQACFVTWPAVDAVDHTGDGGTDHRHYPSEWHLPNVCRLHSIFGSVLPWPQRNSVGVTIPMDDVPVFAGAQTSFEAGSTKYQNALNWRALSGAYFTNGQGYHLYFSGKAGSNPISNDTYADPTTLGGGDVMKVAPNNLWADLSRASLYVNTLRAAVQAQRWYEALARGGNRLDELTAAVFGVVPKDAGEGRPEYLGGKRIPISITQVNDTASNVGKTGAFSLTSDSDYYFTKSFDKWGTLLGVTCIRFRDSFSNRIPRQFKRFERFDHYWPQFANLGEEAIYKYEIDIAPLLEDQIKYDSLPANGNGQAAAIFGYQEYAAEYRYAADIVCGEAAPYGTMGYWTYANYFDSSFDLGTFLTGDEGEDIIANIDRTLITDHTAAGFQFLAQFQFDIDIVEPMPVHSIPGLVDHH